jgi:hypothetical protein
MIRNSLHKLASVRGLVLCLSLVALAAVTARGAPADFLQLTEDTELDTDGTGILDLGDTTVFSGSSPGESFSLDVLEAGASVILGDFTDRSDAITGDFVDSLTVNTDGGQLAFTGDITTRGIQAYKADGGMSVSGIFTSLEQNVEFRGPTIVTLTGDTTLRGRGFEDLRIVRCSVDGPFSLVADATHGGETEGDFQTPLSDIGSLVPLASVSFTGDDIETGNVRTVGDQTYIADDDYEVQGVIQTAGGNISVAVRDIEVNADTTFDSEADEGVDAGDISVSGTVSNTNHLGNTIQFDVIIDASSNGGDGGTIPLGTFSNTHESNTGTDEHLFLDDVTVRTSGTGSILLNEAMTVDGDLSIVGPGGIVTRETYTSRMGDVLFDGLIEIASATTISAAGTTTLKGTLAIDIGGAGEGKYDVLSLVGAASLDEIGLELSFSDGFQPKGSETFKILEFESLTGAFDDIVLPSLDPELSWITSQLLIDGTVTVVLTERILDGTRWELEGKETGRIKRLGKFKEKGPHTLRFTSETRFEVLAKSGEVAFSGTVGREKTKLVLTPDEAELSAFIRDRLTEELADDIAEAAVTLDEVNITETKAKGKQKSKKSGRSIRIKIKVNFVSVRTRLADGEEISGKGSYSLKAQGPLSDG